MQSTIDLVRAVGAEFAKRIIRPLVIVGALIAIALLTLGGWLTTQNAWWWILEGLAIIGTLLFILVSTVICVLLRAVAPPLNREQKQAVKQFVDKLEHVAEHLQTPQLFVIYYVVRDTLRPRQDSFIEVVSTDSKTLAPDFLKLRNNFKR